MSWTGAFRRSHNIWITLVDVAWLVTAACAIVLKLGGRTRFLVGDTLVRLQSSWRFALVALGLGILRVALFGRVRPMPSTKPGTLAGRLEEIRQRVSAPAVWTRPAVICAAVCLLGSTIWIWPNLHHIRLVPDAGDPIFSAWRIARIAHQLVHDPLHLFDGNILYPRPLTLTYSDPTLLEALIGTPFVLAGMDPLIVSNTLMLLAFPACGFAFFYATWRLTADPRAALVAGLVGAWYPFHAEHYSHLELEWYMFVPLAVLALARLVAAPTARRGVQFGVIVALQWLASMYLGVMMMTALVPQAVVLVTAWRPRHLVRPLAAALIVLLPALLVTGIPNILSRAAKGDRRPNEVKLGSAIPHDFLEPHPRLATHYEWLADGRATPERQLFPGISPLALTAVAIIPPLEVPAIAILTSAACTFDWTLGYNGLTYDDLYHYVLPYRGMRVAARFSAVLGCMLALLSGYGAHRLIRRWSTPVQWVITAVLAATVLYDLRLVTHLEEFWPRTPSIYDRMSPEMVVADMPPEPPIDYLYFSTRRWPHLLGGYSGFAPYSDALLDAWRAFPSHESVAALHALGATHLTFNCAIDHRPWRCAPTLEILDSDPTLELVASEKWMGEEVRLYRYR